MNHRAYDDECGMNYKAYDDECEIAQQDRNDGRISLREYNERIRRIEKAAREYETE